MAVTLKVVRGDATPEELAAVIAVMAARSAAGSGEDPTPEPRSAWGAPQLRTPLPAPGPQAWQHSGWAL